MNLALASRRCDKSGQNKTVNCGVPGTDTSSDPGITNNTEGTPKKSKVSVQTLTEISKFQVYKQEW